MEGENYPRVGLIARRLYMMNTGELAEQGSNPEKIESRNCDAFSEPLYFVQLFSTSIAFIRSKISLLVNHSSRFFPSCINREIPI
jgi:hypothetical protein